MNQTCTIHVDDEVNCRIHGLRPEHNKIIWEKLGVFVEGYRWMPAFQLRRWDGKIRFFEVSGKTYTKLLDEIIPLLVAWNYEVNLEDHRLPAPVIEYQIDENFFGEIETKPGWKLRPYQVEVVNALLLEGSGFGVLATGSGKTALTAALSRVLHLYGMQCLIIVPSSDLVTQTVNEFREFLVNHDVTVGEYSGGTKDIDHPIVVATWQSLQNAPHYMKYFKAVIVDECVHPDTLIDTIDKKIPIKDLEIGQLVWTINEQTNVRELKPIIKVHHNLSVIEKKFKIITDDNKELIITGNHKILTTIGWKRVDELTIDDELIMSKIVEISEVNYNGEVFNLHIKDNHNYIANGVIVSNCHGAKAEVIKTLINTHGSHISHRYGVTGTFPKPETDRYSLKLSIGQIIREVPAKWLIEQGYLAEIEILPIETQDIDPELPDYASERAWLTKNEDRNLAIAKYITEISNQYGNTMVLVNTQALQQGREIADLIENAVYLDGGSKKELRQEEYAKYAEQDGVTVIASAGIASTGLSIDRIFALFLLDTGKSFTKCIQSVGRGLRKKGDKTKIIVIDVYSKLKHSKKHAKERKSYYLEAGYPMLPVKKIKY